jgi:hypothetical protein
MSEISKEDKKELKKYGVVSRPVKCHICGKNGGTLVKEGSSYKHQSKCP